jgi:hypothetical protein
LFHQSLGQSVHPLAPVGGTIRALPFIDFNPLADEPVPQSQRNIDGFGGKILRLLVDVDDGGHQRVEVAGGGGSILLPFVPSLGAKNSSRFLLTTHTR